MHRFTAVIGLLALGACGGNDVDNFDPTGTPDPTVTPAPTPDPSYAMRISGDVTDNVGAQGRLAGPGTLAAATSVQAVTLDGTVVATATLDAGAYELGLETVPADALLFVQALDASNALLGSVVVELTDAELLAATPLDVESSVEAEVLSDLLDQGAELAVWAQVRTTIDTAVASAVHAEADVDTAVADTAVGVQAAWEAHVDAWEAAGISVDAMESAHFEAATALSAALAEGDANAYATFQAALHDAAVAQGLSEDAWLEAEGIAHASMRSAILATQAASTVTLEALRTSAMAESLNLQVAVSAQVATMEAGVDTAAVIETAFDDLEAAIEAAGSLEEIETAIDTWRDTVIGAIEDEISSGLDIIDQILAILTDALTQLEAALANLETSIQDVIDAAVGVVDAAVVAADVATAYAEQAAVLAEDLADLEEDEAEAMSTVSLSFGGL